MDIYKSKQLEKLLLGKEFLSYKIVKLLNSGKSAAVFKAINKTGIFFAIKIFDNDLVARFGNEIQEKRIEQEIGIKGHSIPNLVKIIDGGKNSIDSDEYYYLVMEFIDGQNLKQFISTVEYDNFFIKKVVKTIFNITEALLDKAIVHRDIKPENIMIDVSGEIVLMDLGVLKLIGANSFSDQAEKQFVGTLRYAPPEFLTRKEEDSIRGWRSVNLYQIGAVLHDLIMKVELFADITPYSNLVIAIKEDAPKISNPILPFETVQIARDLLIKDWEKRLSVSPKERIEAFIMNNPNEDSKIEKELKDIFSFTSENKLRVEEIEKINRSNEEKVKKSQEISNQLQIIIDQCMINLQNTGLYNKTQKSQPFNFLTDRKKPKISQSINNILYSLEGDLAHGFLKPLLLLVRITNDENSFAEIQLLAMFLSPFVKQNIHNPIELFKEIGREQIGSQFNRPSRENDTFTLSLYDAFTGTIGNDNQFNELLSIEIIKLIKVALKGIAIEVKEELDGRERTAKGLFYIKESNTKSFPKTKMFFSINTDS